MSYTFDVWGLNRRTVEALKAQADNQRFQAEAAYLTLTASVVVAAITEASLRGQIEATNELIAANTKMLDILQRQLASGYANRSDVAAQEAALAQTRATLPPLRKALALQRDLLAALAGIFPNEGPREFFGSPTCTCLTIFPSACHHSSSNSARHPRSRGTTSRASAQIGVATASLLPAFTISGNAGYTNTVLAGLLAPQNLFWLPPAMLRKRCSMAARCCTSCRIRKDTYNAVAWGYRGTVIGAVQNVADALRALQNDADALRAARDFERAAKISYDLARQQMQTGNANVLLLLNAQTAYLQAVIQVVQARAARLADTAALFAALGGGWWNRTTPPVRKPSTSPTATQPGRRPPRGILRVIFSTAAVLTSVHIAAMLGCRQARLTWLVWSHASPAISDRARA